MAWTYSGDPSKSALDKVRFMCGDTDTADQLMSDEELNFLIEQKGSPERAAQESCIMIMSRLAREVDYAIGPEKVSASQRLDNYKKVYDLLKASWTSANAAPSWDDQNAKDFSFDLGMHDFLGGDYNG